MGDHVPIYEHLDVLERPRAAEFGDFVRRQLRDLDILEEDTPAARLVEARDHVEDRGLAGAVRADHGEYLAGLDGKAHAVDGGKPAEAQRDGVEAEQAHRLRSDLT